MELAIISNYLETTSGRDKVFRLLSYAAKLLTACTSSRSTEQKLNIFSKQMSECRVMIRLLDDVPALHDAIAYGWGNKESDSLVRWCQLTQNTIELFYPTIEHITWAGQHKILSINNLDKWDFIGTLIWVISLNLSLVKSLKMLSKLQQYKKHLIIIHSEERPIDEINKKHLYLLLSCIRFTLDIVYAVSYLPPNVLWGGRLKPWQVGLFGTISSCIGLYQSYSSER